MKTGRLLTLVVIALLSIAVSLRCTRRRSVVTLRRIAVPARVLAIGNEALAFEALGDANQSGEASLSLSRSQFRFGKFDRAVLYEYDKQGAMLSRQEINISADSTIAINATAGRRYLIYPDLGSRYRNSYVVICNLRRAGLAGEIVPRICSQILCTDSPFQASQLFERVPDLKAQAKATDLGDGFIGGFGRGGSICERCLGESQSGGSDFVPASGCEVGLPSTPEPLPNPELIVYEHINFPTTADWRSQIYKVKSDGTEVVNLSNNDRWDEDPDVNHHSKRIVFQSHTEHEQSLVLMDTDGNNRTSIPHTTGAWYPKWSRDAESFIVYVDRVGNFGNSIHRIRPDGNDDILIVTADLKHIIRSSDVFDDFHVVYHQDSGAGADSDIFIKDFRDDGTPPNLTSTTDIAEDFPVVSHDGTMIAYRAHHPDEAQSWEIRVARLTLPSTLTLLYPIRFTDPASGLIGAPEFSSDDKRIYVSGYLTEQETSQLFSINLDGSGQFQVTVTDERDYGPSVVPR